MENDLNSTVPVLMTRRTTRRLLDNGHIILNGDLEFQFTQRYENQLVNWNPDVAAYRAD